MDGPLGDLFVPGAGVVGPGRGPRIRSSSGGQDEAIGTPYAPVASLVLHNLPYITAIYNRRLLTRLAA